MHSRRQPPEAASTLRAARGPAPSSNTQPGAARQAVAAEAGRPWAAAKRALPSLLVAMLAFALATALPGVARAQAEGGGAVGIASDLRARLDAALENEAPAAVALRHRIHTHPELSNRETETAALVAEELRRLGLEVETGVAHTGVVGVLRGGRPGPVVAVRADMDALPVTEQSGQPFASTVRTTFLGQEVGVAHACGHDVHTSAALGVAAVLAALRDELPGTVKFLFQPAEEGPPAGERGGAELMMEEGALDDPWPEAIFALHSMPDLEVGQVGWIAGPNFAAVDQFVIRLHGKQAHGAAPERSVDPIVLGSQVVLALQTIASRNVPPLEPVVVTVGIFRGGERYNIIPGSVHLEGTVRTYDAGVRRLVERRMREILDGLTASAGATYELEYKGNAPATINDPNLAARVRPWLVEALGAGSVIDAEPLLAGEDFAYFTDQVPGFYFRLGVRQPGGESGGLHTPTFRADDGAVAVGTRAMTYLVWDYLERGPGD